MAKRASTPRTLQRPESGRQGYHLPWLDSCLEETLLPGKPWHKVYSRLEASLANELESGALWDSPQSQCSLELLGARLSHGLSPALADQTGRLLAGAEMAEVEGDIRQLGSLWETAVESSQCRWRHDGSHGELCPEMVEFVKDTYSLVGSEMERTLAVEEGRHREEEEPDLVEAESVWALAARTRPRSVESGYLHLAMRRDAAYHNTGTGRGEQCAGLTAPPLHCAESEMLGGALSAVLTSDPGRVRDVCERLGGRLLPAALRPSVWIHKLLKSDTVSADSPRSLERRARERFGRTVERRAAMLKLSSATRSPVSGLIENAVVEAYERTPCMQAFATSERLIDESCKALNILYVHSGVYQPGLVHWLFPLQIAFQQGAARGEHCYELAMYLHLLWEGLIPSGPEVSAMAESTMSRVEEQDPRLAAHLRLCASRNGILDPEDDAVQLLTRERREALEDLDLTCATETHLAATRELLENPAVFLRKWMGEGLLGVLDLPAALLIWDQLFMQDWSRRVMEDFCLALLLLLREALLAAKDYPSMREVLLGHVNHLFTADIQRAWIHLQRGGAAADVPGFNRLDTRWLNGPVPEEEAAAAAAHGLLLSGSEIQVLAFDLTRDAESSTHTEGSPSPEESPFLYAPWIPHNPSLAVPRESTVRQRFDLYVDSARYIPDNATVVKVTGRFLRSGFEDLPDITALPDLGSSARSPEFRSRLTVDPGSRVTFDPGMLLSLQVHTVCADTGEQSVVGHCVVPVFDDQGGLNAGGHQVRLRGGGQTRPEDVPLPDSSLRHQPAVPCSSLLIRLLPHTPDWVPAPDYAGGFYFTDEAKPNSSELGIISTFQRDEDFPETVLEMAKRLAEKEGAHVSPERAAVWLEDRLDSRKRVPSHQPPAYLPVRRMVRYRQRMGVRARVTQAFGLPDGLYVNTFSRVLRGSDSFRAPELPQGWGGDEKFLTRHHDYSSLQRAPRWTDPSSVLHPYLDPHSVLLVQLFALDAVYRPDPSGQRCGTVSSRTRGRLELGSKSQLAWTVIPLFDGPCVSSGVHYAPLFQGSPDRGFLQSVMSCPVREALVQHSKRQVKVLRGVASLEVQVWDAHYLDDERHDLPVLDNLLPEDKKKKFQKTRSSGAGRAMSRLVLQTLGRKARRKGPGSAEYQREEAFYEEAMGSTFYSLMETALMNAGYGPL